MSIDISQFFQVFFDEERVALRHLDPIDPFQRQHAAGGALPIDDRHLEVRLGNHRLRQLGGGGRLAVEVEKRL